MINPRDFMRLFKGFNVREMEMKPNAVMWIDLFVGVDLAELVKTEDLDYPISVKSMVGWLVTLGI